ncbi:MAG: hypothetical protein AAF990_22730 [Bacteroidota bacterium]
MKNFFPYLMLLFSTLYVDTLVAQQTEIPGENSEDEYFKGRLIVPLKRSNPDSVGAEYGLEEVLTKRRKTYDFFNTMLLISEPSTISGGRFTDFTKNTNSALQKKSFVLNADIQVPIGMGGKRWRIGKWMNTVHLIPQFKVRILANDPAQGDTSLPVRTPSYLPRLTYYGAPTGLWQRKHPSKKRVSSHFMGFSAFHHSNGQDGSEFRPDGTINTYNGNFGEQVVFEWLIGGYYQWGCNRPMGFEGTPVDSIRENFSRIVRSSTRVSYDRSFYWKLSYEWHERSTLTNQVFEPLDLYGRNRINMQFGLSIVPTFRDLVYSAEKDKFVAVTGYQAKEQLRFVVNFNYIVDGDYNEGDQNGLTKVGFFNLSRRLNFNLSTYWRIRGTPFASLFIQGGYYGSDAYNIYFQESLWQFRFGLATAFFKYPRKGDFDQ